MSEPHLKKRPKKKRKTKATPGLANQAFCRYSRDQLLAAFATSSPLCLEPAFSSILSDVPQEPVLGLQQVFTHSLGENINSRKPLSRPSKSAPKLPKEVPTEGEEVVKKLEEVQIKEALGLPAKPADSGEATQSLLPAFQQQDLEDCWARGNVFAGILLEYGSKRNDLVYMIPYSKSYEKVWFYKSPDQRVHGPFSTIEMFNWATRGFFPQNLSIALGVDGAFKPMDEFRIEQAPRVPSASIGGEPALSSMSGGSGVSASTGVLVGRRSEPGIPLKKLLGLPDSPKRSVWNTNSPEFRPSK